MIKAKVTPAFVHKMNRIKKVKELYPRVISAMCRKNALTYIKTYQKGIRESSLGLKDLTDFTVSDKIRMGLPKPRVPLYGLGKEEKDSLYNGLRIRKSPKGYRVFPSERKHHEKTNESQTPANISIKKLMKIHENGCIIKVTKKQRWFLAHVKGLWLKPETKYIRIPPRPSMFKAHQRYLRENPMKKVKEEVEKATKLYLSTGRNYGMYNIIRWEKKGAELEE